MAGVPTPVKRGLAVGPTTSGDQRRCSGRIARLEVCLGYDVAGLEARGDPNGCGVPREFELLGSNLSCQSWAFFAASFHGTRGSFSAR